MIEAAVQILLDEQNPDGGWGSAKGRLSNTEVTSFAILALRSASQPEARGTVRRGIRWLSAHQRRDGGLAFNDAAPEGSWSTAIAILCLASFPESRGDALRAAVWALGQKGRRPGWLASLSLSLAADQESIDLNPDLQGWPWTADAFSWVEPTSYFLIALKKLRREFTSAEAEGRIRQAEMMMFDRMCHGGGWNYGNSRVLGKKLWPYPDITALALIALQDHPNTAATNKSVEVLKQDLIAVNSGLALSWSVICLALYGHKTETWKKALGERFEKTGFLGEIKSVALALLALGDGVNVFRLT